MPTNSVTPLKSTLFSVHQNVLTLHNDGPLFVFALQYFFLGQYFFLSITDLAVMFCHFQLRSAILFLLSKFHDIAVLVVAIFSLLYTKNFFFSMLCFSTGSWNVTFCSVHNRNIRSKTLKSLMIFFNMFRVILHLFLLKKSHLLFQYLYYFS